MKILLVDDSRAMRMILKRALRQAGFGAHTVVEAENGAQGLEQVRAEHPDVVLSDWNMPVMTGIEFLRALRAEDPRTPFGFVTSEATDEHRAEAREAGAGFFVTKPFKPEVIQAALGPILGG